MAIYDIDAFEAAGYAATYYASGAPSIGVNLNTATPAEIEAAIAAYLDAEGNGAAADYAAAVRASMANRAAVRERLERDLCEAVGLAEIDPAANTYTANKKADEFFAEASRGAAIYTVAGVSAIAANLKRLHDNLLLEDGEPIYTATEEPEVYDAAALEIEVSGAATNFYAAYPAYAGTARVWRAYNAAGSATHTITYDTANARWQLVAAGALQPLLVKADIDDSAEEWGAPAA